MKTILVTGSNGLLGQKITERVLATKQFNLIATAKGANRYPVKEGYLYAEMDILDAANVNEIVAKYQPDAIIHTAAMTNVDTCEDQKELAYALNVKAVETLIGVCGQFDIQLIHLSTDFVFDGADGPYDEEAPTCPLSYYGQTKVEAEELLQHSKIKWAVLRTIIVYGIVSDMSRSNIVLWAKAALEKGQPINVVNDQWRMPTLAEDLADCCLLAVAKEANGIYNASGKDMMSISELVAKVADFWKLDKGLIKEISAETLNQTAKRPVRTGFILDKSIRDLGYAPHSFQEGLEILNEQLRSKETV
ncbi:SDR family oxidoreductase [Pedobacter gandavensis]|uniref:SDR family oxidoreductase n=1 Tax=Pedobacter gandavensis TaxID=2679963 RepID=UPI002931A4E7|nr:SDR family oxidoreductase [Pedobacter gandavensis]